MNNGAEIQHFAIPLQNSLKTVQKDLTSPDEQMTPIRVQRRLSEFLNLTIGDDYAQVDYKPDGQMGM